jgi:hypothetical protein
MGGSGPTMCASAVGAQRELKLRDHCSDRQWDIDIQPFYYVLNTTVIAVVK